MRATLMYAAGDVRVEDVQDPSIVEPTDAIIRITSACICGSDLWPYADLEPTTTGRPMGHEAIGVVEDVGTDRLDGPDRLVAHHAWGVAGLQRLVGPQVAAADAGAGDADDGVGRLGDAGVGDVLDADVAGPEHDGGAHGSGDLLLGHGLQESTSPRSG